jgi:POT family proton-dependent oligopeptide transporter
MNPPSISAGQATVLGHPKGLFVLFFTEMWERFSYYGMRALLIFYLTKHFLFTDGEASLIYGAYTALVYLMPVLGGILADRYLGARKAVTFGAVLLVLGHIGMAIEGDPAQMAGGMVDRGDSRLFIFFVSLGLISAGVGFLKANISTMVGSLYEGNDPRRDGGFTIFYMGINLGSLIAALLCGWLGETYGWSYGFGAAGIGMLFGLVVFLGGQRHLGNVGLPPHPAMLYEKVAGLTRENWVYAGGAGLALLSSLMLYADQIIGKLVGEFSMMGLVLLGFALLMALVVTVFAFTRCTPVERDRLLVLTILIFFSMVFWALFEQAGSSLNLFADRAMDRTFMGTEIRASMFQSLNPLFIIILAPVFSWGWVRLADRGLEPSTPAKFSIGIMLVGAGFLALVLGIELSGDADGLTALWWVVLLYLLHTLGELCLSPVGLSMVTRLSVPRIVGMMMGIWFLATAFANYIAGIIANLTGGNAHGSEIINMAAAKVTYMEVYGKVGWLALGIGVLVLLLSPLLRKGMHVDYDDKKDALHELEEELREADRF